MKQSNNKQIFQRRHLIYAILIASAMALSYLYFDLLGVEEDLVKAEFSYLESKVVEDLEDFFMPIGEDYNYIVQLMLLDDYDFSDTSGFLARFIPLLNNSQAISSVMMANEKGEEMMLLKMEDRFVYRHTEKVDSQLINSRFYVYQGEGSALNSRFQDTVTDYDPRSRPWFKTAKNSAFGKLHWTETPYRFFTTKEIGITLSAKFKDQNQKPLYVAFDVKLNDISKLTESLSIGENGIIFISSNDSLMVGLPKIERLDSLKRKTLLLSPMKDFPSKRVQQAYGYIREQGTYLEPNKMRYQGEDWWIDVEPFEVNNFRLPIIMIAREKDFKGELSKTRNILLATILLIGIFFFTIMRFYAKQRRSYILLKDKNQTIAEQKSVIETHLTELNDSISYSERVQSALLSDYERLPELFPNSFILFLPKDILSGDFYWFADNNGKRFIAAADCTGHGIPGALLSVMGTNFLEDIVIGKGVDQPAEILSQLRAMVVNAFNVESGGKRHDGMDIALLVFDEEKRELLFSGAKNPLYLIRNGELEVFAADRMAVGFEDGVAMESAFRQTTIKIEKGDCLYAFSDGYADQFGGPKGKKFMYGKLKKLLLEIHQEEMDDQKEILKQTFQDWKGDEAQVDDVIIIGIQL